MKYNYRVLYSSSAC